MFHRNRTTLELTAQISNHMRSAIRWFLEPGIQIKVSTFLHFQRLHRPAAEPGQYHIQNNWSTDPRCAVLISNQRLQNRDSITISLLIQNYPYFYETNVLPLNPALYFVRSLKHTNRSSRATKGQRPLVRDICTRECRENCQPVNALSLLLFTADPLRRGIPTNDIVALAIDPEFPLVLQD